MGYTNGLLSALSHAQNGVALTDLAYRYDVDVQLISIDDLLDQSKSKGIAYDAKGNRISKTAKIRGAIETYTYDSQNRLVG